MHHELKILPVYFEQVIAGNKPFEIRDNTDRNFHEGDTVTLNEWDRRHYTGNKTTRQITFVTAYAQQPGFVVFGMREVEPALEIEQHLLVLGEKVGLIGNMATGGVGR